MAQGGEACRGQMPNPFSTVTKKNFVAAMTPGAKVIKLFTAVSYNFS
jgi:hypothetical protein